MNSLLESTPKRDKDAMRTSEPANLPIVHESSSALADIVVSSGSDLCTRSTLDLTGQRCLVRERLVLVVVRRSDATIEAHYHSNDRAQNDQEQLNDLPSRGTSPPILWFRREKFRHQCTQPRKLP